MFALLCADWERSRTTMAAERIAQIQKFEGLLSAPFTPFKLNGDVNYEVIPKYVDHLSSQGVTGVFMNGTTGEGLSLTVSERKDVAAEWVKAGKNKFKILIVQVGANCIRDSIELAAHAQKIGATGIAALPPLFYKAQNYDQLIAYYKELSNAAPDLPVMLYHIPDYSCVQINLAEFLPRARAAIPNFCGAKFTSTEVRDLLNCHSQPGNLFKLLSGYDEVLLPSLSCGVTAAVGASYNFMAPVSLRILDAFKKGDIQTAHKYQDEVLKAVSTITKHGQGISCFKAVMNLLSPIDVGGPRLPLLNLSSEALALLKKDLKGLKTEEWSRK